jgi:hypothetical protein
MYIYKKDQLAEGDPRMKIAYEYSLPSTELLARLGVESGSLLGVHGLAVTAFDGEEPIGFGYVRALEAETAGDCCISVHPAYQEREIDANIRKLLCVRSWQPRGVLHACI